VSDAVPEGVNEAVAESVPEGVRVYGCVKEAEAVFIGVILNEWLLVGVA
jgi:hypothetical protein